MDQANGAWITYAYDAAGNPTGLRTAQGLTTDTYDVLNRLKTVRDASGHLTLYTYEAVEHIAGVTSCNHGPTEKGLWPPPRFLASAVPERKI